MYRLALLALASATLLSVTLPQLAGAESSAADGFTVRGFSDTGLSAILTMMENAVARGRIPSGVAMLARDDEIVWLQTVGEMGPGVPMRKDAIVPLASVGKMYTAVAAMILEERGVIALDDPVSEYIPEFADVEVEVGDATGQRRLVSPERPVTVRDLLTHSGGLTVSGDAFWAAWNEHSERTTTTHLARALAAMPLRGQPGERYEYGPTGASYEVLGAVIEIASGETLEAFMFANIFEPLELQDTFFFLPADKAERLPAFYRNVDGVLQPDRAQGEDFPRSTYFHGGGGVQSSAQDIARFARLFLDGGAVDGVRILEPATVRQMMTNQVGDRSPYAAGRGWGFGASVVTNDEGKIRQYGWVGGGYAILWVDPHERLIAYFAFPIMPPGDNALLTEFQALVDASLAGQQRR